MSAVVESGLAATLVERLACPDCRADLAGRSHALHCPKCGRDFEVRDGIPLLLPRALAEAAPPSQPDGTSHAYQQNYRAVERAERYNAKYSKQALKRASTRREFQLIEQLLGSVPRSEALLDLPSGGGRLSPALAPFTDLIIEADVAFGQLQHGRTAPPLRAPQLWLNASGFDIPLRDRSVDGTVCVRLAHHLPAASERERLVGEILRVSKRFALLTFFDFHSTKNRLRRLRQPFDGKPPKITMTQQELRALAGRSGFSLVACPALSRLFSGHRYALMVRDQ
jgi:uncharacterized protein YbaR (Trm112 family)/SAM-dependent methyltransferase